MSIVVSVLEIKDRIHIPITEDILEEDEESDMIYYGVYHNVEFRVVMRKDYDYTNNRMKGPEIWGYVQFHSDHPVFTLDKKRTLINHIDLPNIIYVPRFDGDEVAEYRVGPGENTDEVRYWCCKLIRALDIIINWNYDGDFDSLDQDIISEFKKECNRVWSTIS